MGRITYHSEHRSRDHSGPSRPDRPVVLDSRAARGNMTPLPAPPHAVTHLGHCVVSMLCVLHGEHRNRFSSSPSRRASASETYVPWPVVLHWSALQSTVANLTVL